MELMEYPCHGVRLVAVDFDRTVVDVHTKGRRRAARR